ncbi:MAG: anaerobic ribonucleoside-triphosphate reductase activating protein [Erysipelotrichaceae bacterium]|nr:anaerobic ribonucleoside-triphosphate reductase activating protein [Erysipelotrichaceae bacterium]MDY5251293.1 anaerobic ribonucleoside-triphosphate reductase activating protein [Erysipelotrichaceae bacterium]
MNFASIKNCDIANGIGVRISLFVSGCTHHCKNCFNQEAWDFNYGEPFGQQQKQQIIELLKPDYIAGLSLLGGEPMEPQNIQGLLPFVKHVKEIYPQKTIWCYSGYTFEQLLARQDENTLELLKLIDILVDGKFVEELKNLSLRFRGSSNQRIIDVPKTLANDNQIILWSAENEKI